MKIDFFSARQLQHSYFAQLQRVLKQKGHASDILWHKSLWFFSFWLKYLNKAPAELKNTRDNCLAEKQNAQKHRHKSKLYWSVYAYFKTLESHILFAIYYGALIKSHSDTLVVWNGLKYRQSIAVCAAKALNIRCLFMENGLIPDTTTIDPRGINYLNSIPRDPQFFIDKNAPPFDFIPTSIPQKPPFNGTPYILVPFQVNTDTQITLFSPWIKDTQSLVNTFITASKALGDNMPLICFKPHPHGDENIQAIKALIEPYSKLQMIESVDTATLIDAAGGIITINSTVGIESLLKQKSVMVLGQTFYAIEGMTLQASNQAQLNQQLSLLMRFTPNEKLLNSFLSYLKNDYQIKTSWKKSDQEHIDRMTKRIIQLSQHVT